MAFLNSTDWDPAVKARKLPLCFVRPQPADMGSRQAGSYLLGAILLSMLQLQGMQQGTLYDPATMEPLARGEVLERALRLYWQLSRYMPASEQNIPTRSVDLAPYHLQEGRCAIALRWSGKATLIEYRMLLICLLPSSPLMRWFCSHVRRRWLQGQRSLPPHHARQSFFPHPAGQ